MFSRFEVFRIFKMKIDTYDAWEDQSRDKDMTFLATYDDDARKGQLTITKKLTMETNVFYLNHLPVGVHVYGNYLALFFANRFYYFDHTQSVNMSPVRVTLIASIKQIEQYFRCHWCPSNQGLYTCRPKINTSLFLIL